MVEVVCEFDYEAEQSDELTIRVGDVIKNVVMAEGGWWEGELNGKKGMFPDNFVKVKKDQVDGAKKDEPKKRDVQASKRQSVRDLANKLKLPDGPAQMRKKDVKETKRKKAKVTFSYQPENDDEIALEVGDVVEIVKQEEEGWWEGVVNGKQGMFPSNFVELVEEGEGNESGEKSGDAAEQDNLIKGKKVQGIGLGNIFGGGPIKLRSTAGKKQGDLPVEPPKVEKREPEVPVQRRPKDASACIANPTNTYPVLFSDDGDHFEKHPSFIEEPEYIDDFVTDSKQIDQNNQYNVNNNFNVEKSERTEKEFQLMCERDTGNCVKERQLTLEQVDVDDVSKADVVNVSSKAQQPNAETNIVSPEFSENLLLHILDDLDCCLDTCDSKAQVNFALPKTNISDSKDFNYAESVSRKPTRSKPFIMPEIDGSLQTPLNKLKFSTALDSVYVTKKRLSDTHDISDYTPCRPHVSHSDTHHSKVLNFGSNPCPSKSDHAHKPSMTWKLNKDSHQQEKKSNTLPSFSYDKLSTGTPKAALNPSSSPKTYFASLNRSGHLSPFIRSIAEKYNLFQSEEVFTKKVNEREAGIGDADKDKLVNAKNVQETVDAEVENNEGSQVEDKNVQVSVSYNTFLMQHSPSVLIGSKPICTSSEESHSQISQDELPQIPVCVNDMINNYVYEVLSDKKPEAVDIFYDEFHEDMTDLTMQVKSPLLIGLTDYASSIARADTNMYLEKQQIYPDRQTPECNVLEEGSNEEDMQTVSLEGENITVMSKDSSFKHSCSLSNENHNMSLPSNDYKNSKPDDSFFSLRKPNEAVKNLSPQLPVTGPIKQTSSFCPIPFERDLSSALFSKQFSETSKQSQELASTRSPKRHLSQVYEPVPSLFDLAERTYLDEFKAKLEAFKAEHPELVMTEDDSLITICTDSGLPIVLNERSPARKRRRRSDIECKSASSNQNTNANAVVEESCPVKFGVSSSEECCKTQEIKDDEVVGMSESCHLTEKNGKINEKGKRNWIKRLFKRSSKKSKSHGDVSTNQETKNKNGENKKRKEHSGFLSNLFHRKKKSDTVCAGTVESSVDIVRDSTSKRKKRNFLSKNRKITVETHPVELKSFKYFEGCDPREGPREVYPASQKMFESLEKQKQEQNVSFHEATLCEVLVEPDNRSSEAGLFCPGDASIVDYSDSTIAFEKATEPIQENDKDEATELGSENSLDSLSPNIASCVSDEEYDESENQQKIEHLQLEIDNLSKHLRQREASFNENQTNLVTKIVNNYTCADCSDGTCFDCQIVKKYRSISDELSRLVIQYESELRDLNESTEEMNDSQEPESSHSHGIDDVLTPDPDTLASDLRGLDLTGTPVYASTKTEEGDMKTFLNETAATLDNILTDSFSSQESPLPGVGDEEHNTQYSGSDDTLEIIEDPFLTVVGKKCILHPLNECEHPEKVLLTESDDVPQLDHSVPQVKCRPDKCHDAGEVLMAELDDISLEVDDSVLVVDGLKCELHDAEDPLFNAKALMTGLSDETLELDDSILKIEGSKCEIHKSSVSEKVVMTGLDDDSIELEDSVLKIEGKPCVLHTFEEPPVLPVGTKQRKAKKNVTVSVRDCCGLVVDYDEAFELNEKTDPECQFSITNSCREGDHADKVVQAETMVDKEKDDGEAKDKPLQADEALVTDYANLSYKNSMEDVCFQDQWPPSDSPLVGSPLVGYNRTDTILLSNSPLSYDPMYESSPILSYEHLSKNKDHSGDAETPCLFTDLLENKEAAAIDNAKGDHDGCGFSAAAPHTVGFIESGKGYEDKRVMTETVHMVCNDNGFSLEAGDARGENSADNTTNGLNTSFCLESSCVEEGE